MSGTDGSRPDRPRRPGTVEVLPDPDVTRIVLRGDVDEELAPHLMAARRAATEAGRPVQVDVADVTFMNSTGSSFIGMLAAAAREPLVLVRPSAEVRFLLELTHTADLVRIEDGDPAGGAGGRDGATRRHLRVVRDVSPEPAPRAH